MQGKLEKYEELVRETIDLDSSLHDIVLLPSLDNELQSCRDEMQDALNAMDDEHDRVGRDLGVDIDKKLHLEKHAVYKYSFRITKAVRGRVSFDHNANHAGSGSITRQERLYRAVNPEIRDNLHHQNAQSSTGAI